MLRAIGYVVVEGSFLASQVQKFAEMLAGTPFVADLLADQPLGSQVKQVRRLVTVVRTREHIDPVLLEQMGQVLSTLDNGPLVRRRNDVAHGLWGAGPALRDLAPGEPGDLIGCDRMNLTGWTSITTTVRSIRLIGDALALAANALAIAGSAHWLRNPVPRWDDPALIARAVAAWDPARLLAELTAAVRAMEGGTADGWLWRIRTTTHRREGAATAAPEAHEPDGPA